MQALKVLIIFAVILILGKCIFYVVGVQVDKEACNELKYTYRADNENDYVPVINEQYSCEKITLLNPEGK